MMSGVIESLAGRVSIIIMSPLSTREIFNSTEKNLRPIQLFLQIEPKISLLKL